MRLGEYPLQRRFLVLANWRGTRARSTVQLIAPGSSQLSPFRPLWGPALFPSELSSRLPQPPSAMHLAPAPLSLTRNDRSQSCRS